MQPNTFIHNCLHRPSALPPVKLLLLTESPRAACTKRSIPSPTHDTPPQVGPEVVSQRLKRFTVPIEQQTEWESARLWAEVGEAITKEDQVGVLCWLQNLLTFTHHQVAATEEKTKLEVAQREALKDRQSKGEDWQTKLFVHEVQSSNHNHNLFLQQPRAVPTTPTVQRARPQDTPTSTQTCAPGTPGMT